MMGGQLNLYRVMSSTFRAHVKPLVMLALLQTFRAVSAVASGLDDVFYRSWRRQPLDRPIFIIGNPRSGTTFLHRLLLGAGDMAAMELWEMMLPPVTARKLLGNVVPRLDKLNPAQYHHSDAHETSLRGIETDDLMWFFHTLRGPFAWAYFLAWQDHWDSKLSKDSFGIGDVSNSEADQLFRYNEQCWRKNLYLKGAGRALIKSSMLTFRLNALLRRYPDCRLLYVVRDPVETIPSGMSLLAGALENAFDIWNSTDDADRSRWLDNLYRASAAMFSSFHDQYTAGQIPERNLCVVRYPDLIQNLEPTVKRILDFIEVDAPEEFLAEVREQSERQRSHASKHGYSPEQFDLTAERIQNDLAFVYGTFELEQHHGLAPADPTQTQAGGQES